MEEEGRFVLILANFGTGKTFLLRELTRRLAKLGYIDALLSPTGEGTATA